MHQKLYHTLPDDSKIIRQQVFVEEQQFHNEFDDIDEVSTHLVLYDGERAVATGRMYEEDGCAVFGRIAVLPAYRGQHLGAMVIRCLEQEAISNGFNKAVLSAQCRVQGFYEKLGYRAMGEVYFDEYCEHIHMEKAL